MNKIVELIINTIILWTFIQTILNMFVSIIYEFCIPWIIWCSLIIVIMLKLVRISPPPISTVQEVLGINPLLLVNDNNSMTSENINAEQYCMRVVAHRGAGYDYPENSLLAFRNIREKGCNATELDLRLTKDNIPIVFHDLTIDRLTGQTGIVSEMTWEELQELDITYNHPLRYKFIGEKIALLHDAVQECLTLDGRLIIDIKETRLDVVQVILDTYEKYPKLFERGIVSSFNPIIVYMIRKREPRIISSLAWRPYFFSRATYVGLEAHGLARYHNPFKHFTACILEVLYEWLLPRFIYYITGISVVMLHKDMVNPYTIEQWLDRDIRIMAWTVNRPSEKMHFSKYLKITYLTDTLHLEKDM